MADSTDHTPNLAQQIAHDLRKVGVLETQTREENPGRSTLVVDVAGGTYKVEISKVEA